MTPFCVRLATSFVWNSSFRCEWLLFIHYELCEPIAFDVTISANNRPAFIRKVGSNVNRGNFLMFALWHYHMISKVHKQHTRVAGFAGRYISQQISSGQSSQLRNYATTYSYVYANVYDPQISNMSLYHRPKLATLSVPVEVKNFPDHFTLLRVHDHFQFEYK